MSGLTHMRILIAADDADEVDLLERLLEDAGYADLLTARTDSLVDLCAIADPDLVLLGVTSERGSHQVASMVGELTPAGINVPVLIVAAEVNRELRQSTLSLVTSDFLIKPLGTCEFLLRVRNLLQISHLRRTLKQRNDVLDRAVHERTVKVEQARLETLQILASVAEFHDDGTHQHAQRVGIYAALIAEALELPALMVARIRDAAPLHDLGKIGISRRVLLKPGELTPAERENMMRHVEIGARILSTGRSPVLRLAAEIARTHHERWDGQGYLTGLAGQEIPLSGRITAVADVFDALTHDRPYRLAWDPDAALAEIAAQANRHFDPRIAAAFLSMDRETLIAGVPARAGTPVPRHRMPVEALPDVGEEMALVAAGI